MQRLTLRTPATRNPGSSCDLAAQCRFRAVRLVPYAPPVVHAQHSHEQHRHLAAVPVRHRQRAERLPYTQAGFPRRPRMPRLPRSPAGTIAAIIADIEAAAPLRAAERAMLRAQELVELNKVKAWQDASCTLAISLSSYVRTLGVPPEPMSWSARGEPMLARVRIGQYSAQGRRGLCGMQDLRVIQHSHLLHQIYPSVSAPA
jgi:hypothetical protein